MKIAFEQKSSFASMPKGNATALRAQAYALAKKVRKLAEKDMTLMDTSDMLDSITMTVQTTLGAEGLVFRRKDASVAMQGLDEMIKQAGKEIEDPMVKEAQASIDRLRQKVEVVDLPPPALPRAPAASDEPPPSSELPPVTGLPNPYFKRER
jgi:hypothetical protein